MIQNSEPVLEKFEADPGVTEISIPSQQENWYPVEAFSIDVTQFALGFVCDDEYGKSYYLYPLVQRFCFINSLLAFQRKN